jgi:hypothetical protein
MAYDPNWPQNGQNTDADRFREQFAGIKDLIDLLPACSQLWRMLGDSCFGLACFLRWPDGPS